ncbi:MAG: peptide-methionine (S)-S-oxide reductase [Zetaproteobacteria bacterium CG_4_9_14_3_um_filter_49_83]|nr:MAG: peptide-methionine (S)-S-oxide reductase [Zetaproteobacteria bacterium CG17_big_fil_post_rev_8_21_14_2_50_50_13]PIV29338.1 MAG: peptide-methionine (S)-S-oxide reductase [Zetaproteobacteria bacterium CG02_land_8_20_14_3_00_50_9]PIY55712.1 MAG: peptide-methionine (S)-S-oxide reductase [Zetaproteobacteria bacterium CG_4_10_14_0_8_um_filter_49_80]PJA36048.1 MAG: peptide-methionine (S)-S-oxide reductase [Zetaproteobacteria bacterium CG_4_9_14_3_um_filter_49_83]
MKKYRWLWVLVFLSGGGGMSMAEEKQDVPSAKIEYAIFAGGCFWCMEHPFDRLSGVISTTSGYVGGHTENPSYEEVSSGKTGHAEAVQIAFDPQKVAYATLLEVFWRNVDPTVKNRQFCDVGTQYRSAIFYTSETQKQSAETALKRLQESKPFSGDIQTEVVKAGMFYPAEDYHQDYYQKNPLRYHFYRHNCGRDQRLQQLWGEEAGGEHFQRSPL